MVESFCDYCFNCLDDGYGDITETTSSIGFQDCFTPIKPDTDVGGLGVRPSFGLAIRILLSSAINRSCPHSFS
jgi:hypothetical protein